MSGNVNTGWTTTPYTPPESGKLALALSKAQKAFPAIPKTRTAKVSGTSKQGKPYNYEYHYADLSDVLDAVRGPLADNELAVVQPITTNGDGNPRLRTILLHSSGEQLSSTYPLPDSLTAQEMGSAITYARRYSLTSMLGIATEDDDGAAATESGKAPKKPAAKKGQTDESLQQEKSIRSKREQELLALPAELNLSAEKAVEVMRDVIGHTDMTKASDEELDLLEAGFRGTAESIAKAFGTEAT